MDHFIMFSIENCQYCEKSKQLFKEKQVSCTTIQVDKKDPDYQHVKNILFSMAPDQKTFPFIFKRVGGYSDLRKHLNP